MKITEKQKNANRKKILNCAVDLMGAEGISKVSMRKIAKEAGVAEATIYNYFPSKDQLIIHYFSDRSELVVAELTKITGWERYTFSEQFQAMIHAWLDQFAIDRSFVTEAFPLVFMRPIALTEDAIHVRQSFIDMTKDIVDAAVEVDEIPASSASYIVNALSWDYFIGVVSYWLRDRSNNFGHTTELIDKSVRLSDSLLKTRVIDHGVELLTFLFRSHVVAPFESASKIFDESPLKRAFFGDEEKTKKSAKKKKSRSSAKKSKK